MHIIIFNIMMIAIIENWNQDQPKRNSYFSGLYIKCLGQAIMDPLEIIFQEQSYSSLHSGMEFLFQEQSYSSLHSGWSLACDHFRGDIDDPCSVIADFYGVIADFCGVITYPCGIGAIPEEVGAPVRSPIVARLAKHHKTLLNIVKHHETHVKHHETHVKHCDTS